MLGVVTGHKRCGFLMPYADVAVFLSWRTLMASISGPIPSPTIPNITDTPQVISLSTMMSAVVW